MGPYHTEPDENLTAGISARRVGGVFEKLGALTAAANGHSLTVSADGSLYSAGREWDVKRKPSGQLGRDGPFDRPLSVKGGLAGKKVVDVAAGKFHSVAVTSDGAVYTWGLNNRGQLGRVTPGKLFCRTPTRVKSGLEKSQIVAVSAGPYYTIAVSNDGKLFTWGLNWFQGEAPWRSHEEEDNPEVVAKAVVQASLPRPIESLERETVIDVACGPEHWLALTSEGQVYAASTGFTSTGLKWDIFEANPKLGREITDRPTVPEVVQWGLQDRRVLSIAASKEASFAVTSDGFVFSWGVPGAVLGRNGDSSRGFEVREILEGLPEESLLSGKLVREIAAGEDFLIVRTEEGQVFTWGHNHYKQLGRPAGRSDIVPRQVSSLENCKAMKVVAGTFHGLVVCIPIEGQDEDPKPLEERQAP